MIRWFLFSPEMVRAILSDYKSQTRRIPKLRVLPSTCQGYDFDFRDKRGQWNSVTLDDMMSLELIPSPGDTLRVKEATWLWCYDEVGGLTPTGRPKHRYRPDATVAPRYVATSSEPTEPPWQAEFVTPGWGWRYKTARFMPAWACRLELEVEFVRLEYLQDITADDIRREGVTLPVSFDRRPLLRLTGKHMPSVMPKHPRDWTVDDYWRFEWINLWDGINGARPGGAWADDPFVVVIGFGRKG